MRRGAGWQVPDGEIALARGVARCVRVAGDPGGVLLELDGVPSSHLDVNDPLRLDFEYMAWMFAAVTAHLPACARLRALHLGGGGCALPRALDAHYRDARQLAIEVDPVLAAKVREWFPLPRAPRLRIRAAEAGAVVAGRRAGLDNLVIRDAFASGQVPRHLATPAFAVECRRILDDDGIYLANCAGSHSLDDAKAELAAVAAAFPVAAVIAEPAQLRGRRWGNAVIVGGPPRLAETAQTLTRSLAALPFPARIIAGQEASTWAGRLPPAR
jgi:spermidine synthase